ncbi:MAG: SBBP repeat-containing protein, partial [bacterium]
MKNKITFLILFIVLGFCSLQAQVTQEWVQIYTGPFDDKASSIAVDDSENVYVSGRSYRSGTGHNCATIKYNSSGVQQWGQSHNGFGTGFYGPTSLEVDNSGNVYITGSSAESGTYPDYTTIKYNSSGVQTWIQSYNGPGNSYDGAHSLAVDGSGNVYVTGHSPGIGTNNDYATIKYSSSGDQQWVQRYNGPGNLGDYANSLAVDDSGNVYVTGSSGNGINSDYATIKYNSSGVQQWVQRYNGTGNNHNAAHSIAVDYSGNVYVTGKSDSYPHTVYATIKYNSSGVQQWIQEYGPINNVENAPPSLAVDGSGNAYITGNSVGSGTSADYATVKYNSSGVQQWVQLYNGPGNGDDGATSLAVDISGNVFVTGGSIGSGSSYDYATIKYNSSGVQQWVQTYNGNNYDIASSLALDGSGNVYVTGGSIGSGTSYDYATIKYSQTDDISAPSNLEAQSVDSSFIKVTWQDNSNDEDGFYIERTQINDSSHWEV